MFRPLATAALATLALSACHDPAGSGASGARDQIRAVGSSTVFPFATAVAEIFVKAHPGMKSPIIESTGTGAGMKLFCAGVGADYPDIENASRRIKPSEFAQCAANGVRDIAEIQVGVDGLVFAESKNGPGFRLTPQLVYAALAANPYGKGPNRAKTWKEVDPSLPAVPIVVFGPPSTSGTRDSLAELILDKGCDADPAMAALRKSDEKKHRRLCQQIREDGAYVDAGENDNLIVQKLVANPDSLGVFGYSYYEENRDRLTDVPLNGIAASYDSVAGGTYPGARALFLYVKKAHLDAVPGLRAYVESFAKSWNPGGPLTRRGLVASPDAIRAASAEAAESLPSLTAGDLR